jgi:hypothetical protein
MKRLPGLVALIVVAGCSGPRAPEEQVPAKRSALLELHDD